MNKLQAKIINMAYNAGFVFFRLFNKIRFYKEHKTANIKLIPKNTFYCYDNKGICPYHRTFNCKDKQSPFNNWCVFCNDTDGLILWDDCKICGVSEPSDWVEE